MALRILTGVLVVDPSKRTDGKALIRFDTHSITGDAVGGEKDTEGSPGKYANRPGKVISLREVQIRDKDTLSGGSQNDALRVGDDFKNNNEELEVKWRATGGSEIRELSYMIVGHV